MQEKSLLFLKFCHFGSFITKIWNEVIVLPFCHLEMRKNRELLVYNM